MPIIIGIKFNNKGKLYYFDPQNTMFNMGDGVIVDTARGEEYAFVHMPNTDVDDSEIITPLKCIIRKATNKDSEIYKRNQNDKIKVLKVTAEKISHLKLNMKVVDAEYVFDRSKLLIYFTAEGRIDFRELLKELAPIFKLRIELRQIYERDEARLMGAISHCGRTCCCHNHLADFEKVSIKMAKIQGLPLNPQKISGHCGRLMCCLAYENEYYREMFNKMPKVGSIALTPDGEGVVESNDILRQTSKIKLTLKDGTKDWKTYKLVDLKKTIKQTENELLDTAEDDEFKMME